MPSTGGLTRSHWEFGGHLKGVANPDSGVHQMIQKILDSAAILFCCAVHEGVTGCILCTPKNLTWHMPEIPGS